MMTVKTIVLGDLRTNCYLVRAENSDHCCLIDPADEADALFDYLLANKLTLDAIFLTHGHYDHVGAVRALAGLTRCRVYLNERDLTLPTNFTGGPLYYTDSYDEGDHLSTAGLEIDVMATPGHTEGSVCLRMENNLFAGDTLFAGACGRTDLPGGNSEKMWKSLARLAAIPEELRVFPGHGSYTTLAREQRTNPYLN